jgi:hypothetical protein
MRPPDDDMLDPEMEAEFAELAVLLAAERAEPDADFIRVLDARVARRFAPANGAPSRRRLRFTWQAGAGSLAAGIAAIAAVVVIGTGGGGGQSPSLLSVPSRTTAASSAARSSSSASSSSGASGAFVAPSVGPERAPAAGTTALTPPNNGRKIIQSAQLTLTAAPAKVESVAQEVFDVVGRESGVVRSSNVTATGGLDSSAEFELSVPSSSLANTMTALSRLHDANVASRTDSTTDVNDRSVSLTRQLADARALRTGLLGQLARATTQTEVDSLHARIRDAESSIASLESRLRSLDRAVSMSRITLTINAAATPAGHRASSSFTLGKAAHDAGRVLTVAAGVALITLAGLVPVALLVGIAAWVAVTVRQRRRERSLDVA